MVQSPLFGALKEIGQFLGKKLDAVIAAVNNQKPADLSAALSTQTRLLSQAINGVETSLKALSDIEVKSDVSVDTSSLESEVKAATSAIKALTVPDVGNIEKSLKLIATGLVEGNKATQAALMSLQAAIGGVSFSAPDTIKIDAQQMRAITGTMRGGSASAAVPLATRVSNTTVSATATDTEYSYTFPAATVGWVVKLRDQGTLSYYSWTTGTLPTSGTGTTYMTIPQNFLRSQDNVDYSGKTIFLGAESASQTFEIEVFRQ